jgi:hypothetical protein
MKNNALQITNFKLRLTKILCVLCVLCGLNYSSKAQSVNQSYPTPVTTNEISGKIPARDIGDARLTGYFYVFNGRQGDVFINVVTSNLNGDIDIFTANNLKPLSKITVYADESERETGRVIYLRQPEKLVLRVEGRSPNDDAAIFRIKFAGSFEPMQSTAENTAPEAPVVKNDNQTDVRVNSVGTIIEIKPKPTPQPKETIAKNEIKPKEKKSKSKNKITKETENQNNVAKETTLENEKKAAEEEKPVDIQKESAAKVVVTDELANKEVTGVEKTVEKDLTKEKAEEVSETEVNKKETENTVAAETAKTEAAKEAKKTKKSLKAIAPAELENIKLVVLFKDGSRIERPMSEILKVNVDKGILTISSKDGIIGRFSILDVTKMTIE